MRAAEDQEVLCKPRNINEEAGGEWDGAFPAQYELNGRDVNPPIAPKFGRPD